MNTFEFSNLLELRNFLNEMLTEKELSVLLPERSGTIKMTIIEHTLTDGSIVENVQLYS